MTNPFTTRASTLAGPARDYAPITPSDTDPLPKIAVAVYVETGGAVVFVSEAGQQRTVELPDYGWLLCGVRQVRATGTTASGLHAMVIS